MPEIISGLKWYRPDTACRNGHLSERYVKGHACVECVRLRYRNLNPLRSKCHERMAARAAGETRFFTGKPCRHGHAGDRRTGDGKCVECATIRKRRNREAKKRNLRLPVFTYNEPCKMCAAPILAIRHRRYCGPVCASAANAISRRATHKRRRARDRALLRAAKELIREGVLKA